MINYCLPIVSSSFIEIEKIINKNTSKYSFFEIWADYIDDLNILELNTLVKKYKGKLIILFRRLNLEKARYEKEKVFQILKELNKNCFIDFDISVQLEYLDYFKKNTIQNKLITSFHNYSKTPDNLELAKIIKQMEKFNPDIYKTACFSNSFNDSLRLLDLQSKLLVSNKKVIVLGMGEYGKVTRVFGSLYGNEMIFANNKTKKTANGQLNYDQLNTIFKTLEEV